MRGAARKLANEIFLKAKRLFLAFKKILFTNVLATKLANTIFLKARKSIPSLQKTAFANALCIGWVYLLAVTEKVKGKWT